MQRGLCFPGADDAKFLYEVIKSGRIGKARQNCKRENLMRHVLYLTVSTETVY